jgi:alpha-D-ribose 1-methylphosphonate 5-triphosphate synthase subunit PhnH
MRTTVTIDPDVETLLNKAMRERDASFKQVLNDAVRSGLQAQAQRQAARPPFKQRTFSMGKPLVDLTKALSLAGELEDAELMARMQRRHAKR